MRRRIRILPVGLIAPIVVQVGSNNASRPSALRELAVGGVGVGRAFAVGIDFVGHCTGGDVVEPGGGVALNGRAARSPSLVAICCHRGLVAEDIVGVANGVGCSALVGLVPAKVVFVDNSVAERIGDGGEIAELIIGVSRAVAEGVNRSGTLTEGVVFNVARVATTVGVGDLETKGIVGNGVGDSGNRDRLNLNPIARDCQRSICSIRDNLGRCNYRDGNMHFVFSHIAADVCRAGARGKRGSEASELARRGRDERSDGGIGTGDDVGLGEVDDATIKRKTG